MTTSRQYFPVSVFKTQTLSFMTPAILKRVDGANFPVEYMEMPGRGSTTTNTGFFFEAPLLFAWLVGNDVNFIIDFFPIVDPPAGGAGVVWHVDICATSNSGLQSILTDSFVVNPNVFTTTVPASRGGFTQQSVNVQSAQQDSWATGRRATVRVYRQAGNAADTYADAVGVTGVWASYSDV